MEQFLPLLLIPIMSLLARQSGGGAGAAWLVYQVGTHFGAKAGKFASNIPEILWALTIAAVTCYAFHGSIWNFLFFAVWSYIFMQVGHGNAYHDGMYPDAQPDRWQTLDWLVRPFTAVWRITWQVDGHEKTIFKKTGLAARSKWYCRIFMGVKGLLIGAPMLYFGLPLIILWPLGYAIGFRYLKKDSGPAEYITGAFAGACLAAAAIITH